MSVGAREQRRLANEALVLAAIHGAAKDGAVCPRDLCMAEATGLTRNQVKGALRSMSKSGTIKIETKGGTRRITIVCTGEATGWTHLTPRREDAGRGSRLMEIIIQKAEAGEEMPRGQALAEMIGSTAETATRDLRSLERLGVIKIEEVGTKRKITVVATGAETAVLPGDGRPRRLVRSHRKRAEEAREAYVDEAPPPPVSFIPCARRDCVGAAAFGRAYCGEHEMEVAA